MSRNDEKRFIEALLNNAGIAINGDQPCDVSIHNEALFSRILQQGTLGLGEAYMDGWWDCDRLDVLIDRLTRKGLSTSLPLSFKHVVQNALGRVLNLQSMRRAKQNVRHYNLSNKLFKAMLDKRMIYSCGYYKNATNLDEAQEAKLDLICQKLQLQPGMRLLDVGCGWGGLAQFAATRYDVFVVGLTISEQQHALAKETCRNMNVDIRLQDYRQLPQTETFDRVVSVGMFEHVGHSNYREFMTVIHRTLANEGLFLLHTIGVDKTAFLADEWIRKYIFPNGMLPSATQITQAAEPYFVLEDWQNFGVYYDKTLMDWHQNFLQHWIELKDEFDERFFRMWTYYLLTCAGGFRARDMQLWQVVFSKGRMADAYIAPR